MYKFQNVSLDGKSELKYNSLEEFESAWTNGKPADFSAGYHVTDDGVSAIRPLDAHTENALLKRSFVHRDLEKDGYLMPIINSLGEKAPFQMEMISEMRFNAQQNPESRFKPLETPAGRAYLIDLKNTDVSDADHANMLRPLRETLVKSGMDSASVTLEGVLVVEDKLEKEIIVIDTLNQSNEISDLSNREQVKAVVMNAKASSFEGFTDDGEYSNSKTYGSPDIMSPIIARVDAVYRGDEVMDIDLQGYTNSPDNPLDITRLKSIIEKLEANLFKDSNSLLHLDHKETGEPAIFLSTSNRILNIAGSKEKGLYLDLGKDRGGVTFVGEGQGLLISGRSQDHVEISDLQLLSEYQKAQSLDEILNTNDNQTLSP